MFLKSLPVPNLDSFIKERGKEERGRWKAKQERWPRVGSGQVGAASGEP